MNIRAKTEGKREINIDKQRKHENSIQLTQTNLKCLTSERLKKKQTAEKKFKKFVFDNQRQKKKTPKITKMPAMIAQEKFECITP